MNVNLLCILNLLFSLSWVIAVTEQDSCTAFLYMIDQTIYKKDNMVTTLPEVH